MIRKQTITTILYLLAFVGLNSCLTVRQIERNCDQFAKICLTTETETTITIHDTAWIEKRDTVVLYELVRETTTDTVFVRSDGGLLSSDTSTLATGLAYSTAFVYDSRLFHTLESGDTILNIRLNDAITERNQLRKEIRDSQITNTVTVKEDTGFGKFAKKWFFGTVILIIIELLLLFFKIRSRFFGK